jgi:activator of 2-hydroxyglutaryl-CoA dehydratase
MELKRLFQIDIAPLTVDPQLIGALGAAILASRKG